jgi:phosphoserine phosphatase RsbU/P
MSSAVLLIDDDDSLRELLAMELETAGISVLHARKLKDGREIFHAFTPRVVVVDGFLPDGRGLDFIEALPPGARRSEIIFMSGHWSDRRSLEALREAHGLAGVFAKPFEIGDMTRSIRELLAGPRGG